MKESPILARRASIAAWSEAGRNGYWQVWQSPTMDDLPNMLVVWHLFDVGAGSKRDLRFTLYFLLFRLLSVLRNNFLDFVSAVIIRPALEFGRIPSDFI